MIDQDGQYVKLLSFFEISPHPLHSNTRAVSSMFMLDTIIRTLSLTSLDADNPATSRFKPKTVPAVSLALHQGPIASWGSDPGFTTSASQCNASDRTAPSNPARGCSCLSLSLGHRWSDAREHAPLWMATPGWDDAWTPGEIRKETCRRLCWHSMMLTAGFTSYMDATRRMVPEFFVGDPVNVRGLIYFRVSSIVDLVSIFIVVVDGTLVPWRGGDPSSARNVVLGEGHSMGT